MGSCLSKKEENNTGVALVPGKAVKVVSAVKTTELRKAEGENVVKKEIFIIKHRRSHSHDKQVQPPESPSRADQIAFGTPVSCTREEVDAILIQCGRLSRRSSSANTPAGKKYSGSKRSFDFDNERVGKGEEDEPVDIETRSRSSPSNSGRRRRTPSRERDSSQQRSGSRERWVAGSGRRVSRSPGRRSETPATVAGADTSSNGGARPGKLVSVPASVTGSLGAANEQGSVRRIAVRRDVRSPRSQSPALALSRSNSRKADEYPHRRNPLSEIDNNHSSQHTLPKLGKNQCLEKTENMSLSSKRVAGLETTNLVQAKTIQVSDSLLQPMLIRSRSLSRSQDFDELSRGSNPNPDPTTSSYASILLEDIQKFHQKSSSSNVPFALPKCVTKACSILEAVADMNSTTSSSIEDKKQGERNELLEPSLHKYVTMRRGTRSSGGNVVGDQESSVSNSGAGGGQGQQRWGSPLEPNSVECSTFETITRNKALSSPLGFKRQEFL
ncbi:unnamed protein product [Rhodiola kirilowii]